MSEESASGGAAPPATEIDTSDRSTPTSGPLPRISFDEDATELWTPEPDEPYSSRSRSTSTTTERAPTTRPSTITEITMTVPAEPPPPPPTRSWLWMLVLVVTLISAALAAFLLLR